MPKEAGKMSRAAPPTAFGPEGGPIDKIREKYVMYHNIHGFCIDFQSSYLEMQ